VTPQAPIKAAAHPPDRATPGRHQQHPGTPGVHKISEQTYHQNARDRNPSNDTKKFCFKRVYWEIHVSSGQNATNSYFYVFLPNIKIHFVQIYWFLRVKYKITTFW